MKLVRFFLPRIEYILLIAVFWGIAASGPRILNFDGDLPRHILTGNLILQTRHVSTTDIFSFRTTGRPRFPHEWLSQVFFAFAYDWLGLNGVVLLTALVIMLTWWLVFRHAIRKSNSFFAALILVALAVGAGQIHVLPRPHIFTYLLTAIWITLLENIAEGKTRSWWMFPIVMLLWVNLHGMFVLGILILGIYLAGDFLDQPSTAWFTKPKTNRFCSQAGHLSWQPFFLPQAQGFGRQLSHWEATRISQPESRNISLPISICQRLGHSLSFFCWS